MTKAIKTTKIAIVEDHPIFSKGLIQLINSHNGYTVVGEAACSCSAVALVENTNPDIVIVDLNLGYEDGLELIKIFRSLFQNLLILVLSMHDERIYSERVLRAGARGYIMKEEVSSKVIEAIETVMSGKVWLSDSEHERLFYSMNCVEDTSEEIKLREVLKKLSDRQLQIFIMLGKGFGSLEIATRLGLSTKTVGTHKEQIKSKMGCLSVPELIQLAIKYSNN